MTRILVIDDDDLWRKTVCTLLEQSGYLVRQAGNGEEGVRLALDSPPELIICDVVMAKLDGLGVFDRLRNEGATRCVPFIFMTGFIDKDSARGRLAMGADCILIKPFALSLLLDTVKECLAKTGA